MKKILQIVLVTVIVVALGGCNNAPATTVNVPKDTTNVPPSIAVGEPNPNLPKDGGELPVMCTMDAKQCPDGSYVGRGGPKCEFSPCPGATPTK